MWFPTLRFSEFSGEWEVKKLGEVGEIVGGGTPSTDVEEYWNGNIQWFTPTEIKKSKVCKSIRTITKLGLKKSSAKLLPKGTILLTTRATIGEVAIAEQECTTNQGFQSLIVNENASNLFILNWIKQNKHQFTKRANGSTFPEISKKEVTKINIHIPKIKEQTKIANFLSKLDEKIQTQRETIRGIEKLRQSLNDDLFNKYGNDIEISLSDLGNSYTGLSGKTAIDFGKGKPYVTYKNIFKNDIIDEDKFEYVNITTDEKQNRVKYGDALFTISSETPTEVGICSVYFGKEELYLNSFCFGYRLNDNNTLIPEYLPYLFSNSFFRKFIYPFAQGSTRYNLLKSSLMTAKFTIPTVENQKRITNLLSSLSQKLKTEQELLSAYEQQKKYFLQNMFV